ncbi:MAG: hypothetical protein ABI465_19300 [Ktedonobacteraceae bacterium]
MRKFCQGLWIIAEPTVGARTQADQSAGITITRRWGKVDTS